MLFVAKLNGDPVAITAGGLVPITKPLIVTVMYSVLRTCFSVVTIMLLESPPPLPQSTEVEEK